MSFGVPPFRLSHRLKSSILTECIVARYEQLVKVPAQGTSLEAFAIALVRALRAKGAGLLLGTNAYKPNVIPGFPLLGELRYFVKADLSPYEAIKAGTSDAARFLNQENEFGVIAVGRRADLLLLDTNPLADVKNLSKRVGVMVNGHWLNEGEPRQRLNDADFFDLEGDPPTPTGGVFPQGASLQGDGLLVLSRDPGVEARSKRCLGPVRGVAKNPSRFRL